MQTIERIIAMFEPGSRISCYCTQLSPEPAARSIAMRLAAAKRGGRVPVCEIMLGTGTVRKLISEKRIKALQQAIANRDQEHADLRPAPRTALSQPDDQRRGDACGSRPIPKP
jgi:Tfp pilus assembly pilus retraction ATPase PilT